MKIKEDAKGYRLNVNEWKTKYVKCGRRETNENKLQIETMEFEKVQSFKYLCWTVNQNSETEEVKENMQGIRLYIKTKTKLHGLSPRANYTDRATAACRRSDCQLLRIEGAMWSACWIPTPVFSVF
jgi:hypothetical protein